METNENVSSGIEAGSVCWRRVLAFLGLTFGVTYAYNLLMALTVGYGSDPVVGIMLQGMMLIPACSALVLQMFVFSDSPLYFRKGFSWLHLFGYFFLLYGIGFLVTGIVLAGATDRTGEPLLMGVAQFVTLGGVFFVFLLQFLAPKEERQRLGLALGPFKWYVLFALLIVVMYSVMTALNYLFKLGEVVDAKALIRQLAQASGQSAEGIEEMPNALFLLTIGFQTAFFTPIVAWLITFGEEYGWRGFLQSELIKLGKVRGVALVGLIWGLWHAPVIAMGHNYPGYPVWGVFLMVFYCVFLGFILGLAVLKSRSVWLAAYLHGVNNQALSFLVMMVYKPDDPVFSFGAGIYGVVTMALVVGLLLLDKTWKS